MAITALLTRSATELSFAAALTVVDVAGHTLRVEQVAPTRGAFWVVVISFGTLVTELPGVLKLARALQFSCTIRPFGNADW